MPGQAALAEIVREFGPDVLAADGSLDRKRVGAIVFGDARKRRRLEAITHPAIRVRQQRILSVYEEEAFEGIVIWDVALLIETSGAKGMDRVVVVITDPATELQRLMARDGFSEEDARRRIASQMPLAEKVKVADYVIDNSGARAETERLVRDVYRALLKRPRDGPRHALMSPRRTRARSSALDPPRAAGPERLASTSCATTPSPSGSSGWSRRRRATSWRRSGPAVAR